MTIWDKIKYQFNNGDSAVRQIIIVNLAVFIFQILVGVVATLYKFESADFLQYFFLLSDVDKLLVRPWTLITNIFFHRDFTHILVNLIVLFMIGRILEGFMSSRKFWQIFFFGGIAGSLLYVFSYNFFPIFYESNTIGELVGCSGGVTAIIAATGVYLPRYEVRLFFSKFKVELRWVALVLIFRDLYAFPDSNNLGGLLAHLGGVIFGALYILNMQDRIKFPSINLDRLRPKMSKKITYEERKTKDKPTSTKKTKPNQQAVDAILDKISQSGYDSLTKTEKEILFKASE
jgi:membrane associated rhomboid family serine protease